MSFTELLERDATAWWAEVEFDGWGRRLNATEAARRHRYRFSSIDPFLYGGAGAPLDAYFVAIPEDGLPGVVQERIELRRGSTRLGQLSFELVDGQKVARSQNSDRPHGWGTQWDEWGRVAPPPMQRFPRRPIPNGEAIADLMAVEGPHLAVPMRLTVNVTAAAGDTTWTVDSAAEAAAGQAWWIGAECVIITGINGNAITVLRAQYGTPLQEHRVQDDPLRPGDGFLYDRPRYVRGRGVRLYVNLFDTQNWDLDFKDGVAGSDLDRRLVWAGTVDDWEMVEPGRWQFACRPELGRLDRALGRNQFSAKAPGWIGHEDLRADDRVHGIDVEIPDNAYGVPREPQRVLSGDPPSFRFHAQLGKEIVRVLRTRRPAWGMHPHFFVERRGLLGTEAEGEKDKGIDFHEVLLSHPYPELSRDNDEYQPFTFAGGNASTHPVDIMLALMTSTGLGTNGDWDVLPANWGAGLPISSVNEPSFVAMQSRASGVAFPNMVLGWKGKNPALRRILEEEILAPMGWFLFLDENGKVALGSVGDVFNADIYPELTEDDLAEEDDGGHRVRMMGQLDETTSAQQWEWDWDWSSDKPRMIQKFRLPESLERMPDDNSELSIKARSMTAAQGAVTSRGNLYAKWWSVPLPKVEVTVALTELDLSITQPVLLTISTLPNPFTGSYGFVQQPCIVVGRGVSFEGGTITLELLLVPRRNVGYWVPAVEVTVWDAPTLKATCKANEFSASGSGGIVPSQDVLGFEVGDQLMLLDSDLQVLSDTPGAPPTVQGIDAITNELEISHLFRDAANMVVNPAAGNLITYCNTSGANQDPTGGWSKRMLLHVAQADSDNDELPSGDAAYIYGT